MDIIIRQPLGFSEIGRKDNQEDCVYPSFSKVNKNNRFFILCDGMGGHDNGEVASSTVCEALGHYFETHIPEDGVMTVDIFNSALGYAYDCLDKKESAEQKKKMGTTMTCLYLHKNGYLVAHIGDSRIYHVRPKRGILYQSSDHSLVNDLLRVGELTEEEAVNYPHKNIITRAMQPNLERRHKADVFSFDDVVDGDYFFLCSDGVLEQLTNDALCEILSDDSLSDSQKLAAIKNISYGNTKDNFTCYLIPVDKVLSKVDKIVDDNIIVCDVHEEEEPTVAPVMEEKVVVTDVKKKKVPSIWKWVSISLFFVVVALLLLIWKSNSSETTVDTPEKVEELIDNKLKSAGEQPADAPVEQPADAPVEQPADASVEQPADASAEQPTDAPAEQLADAPAEQPADAPAEQPADAPAEQPADAPAEQPADAPAEQPADAPTKKTVPVDKKKLLEQLNVQTTQQNIKK